MLFLSVKRTSVVRFEKMDNGNVRTLLSIRMMEYGPDKEWLRFEWASEKESQSITLLKGGGHKFYIWMSENELHPITLKFLHPLKKGFRARIGVEALPEITIVHEYKDC